MMGENNTFLTCYTQSSKALPMSKLNFSLRSFFLIRNSKDVHIQKLKGGEL